jgi:hypothetical protein
MKFRLIAPVLAAALALTSIVPAPASALDGREQRNLLITLGALAIVGAAIADQNSRRYSPPAQRYYAPPPPPRYYAPPPVTRYYVPPQPVPQPWHRYDDDRRYGAWLPGSCQFQVNTRYGTRTVLGQRCLQQNRVATGGLPRNCAMIVNSPYGSREVYSSSCLADRGYRIAGR